MSNRRGPSARFILRAHSLPRLMLGDYVALLALLGISDALNKVVFPIKSL